jgi:hypothetical protein
MVAAITIPGMFLTGDHATRPAASAVGTGSVYCCSTHSLINQSDGSSWTTWATLGGGTVDAGDVTFTPAGTIAATDVQAAIEEVASEAAGGNAISTTTIRRTTTQNVAGSGTATPISFDTEDEDTDGAWAVGTPTKIVIPSGLNNRRAIFWGWCEFTASTNGNYRILAIRKATADLTPPAVLKAPDAASAITVSYQVRSHVTTLATADEYTLEMIIDSTGIGLVTAAFGFYTVY